MLQELIEVGLELFQFGVTTKRFVETEKSHHHVSFDFCQPGVGGTEIFVTMTERHLIPGDRQIAEDQILLWIGRVNVGFQPSVMLHAVGQGVADDGDMVAVLEVELRGRCAQGHCHSHEKQQRDCK